MEVYINDGHISLHMKRHMMFMYVQHKNVQMELSNGLLRVSVEAKS